MNSAVRVNPATMLLCNFVITETRGGNLCWKKLFPNAFVMATNPSGKDPEDEIWVAVVDNEYGQEIDSQWTTVANLPLALLKAMGIAERHRA